MIHVASSIFSSAVTSSSGPFCIAGYESSKGAGGKAAWEKGVEPWTAVYPGEAFMACRAAGATLCTDKNWVAACSGADNNKWSPVGSFTKPLDTVWVHQGVVWVAGVAGVIARYDGSQWHSSGKGANLNFAAIHGTSNNDIWLVGYEEFSGEKKGIVFRYNGTSWT